MAVTATGVIGGLASRPADSPWYRSLRMPLYQPPRQAFPIVWPMVYADIVTVSSNALDEMELRWQKRERRQYIIALAMNLMLNASWHGCSLIGGYWAPPPSRRRYSPAAAPT